jgi:hypothetical protein
MEVSLNASSLATEFDEKEGSFIEHEMSRVVHVSFQEDSEPSIVAPSIGGLFTEESDPWSYTLDREMGSLSRMALEEESEQSINVSTLISSSKEATSSHAPEQETDRIGRTELGEESELSIDTSVFKPSPRKTE